MRTRQILFVLALVALTSCKSTTITEPEVPTPAPISPIRVVLSQDVLNLTRGQSVKITFAVLPANATYTIDVSNTNNNVATFVFDGKVATITGRDPGGSYFTIWANYGKGGAIGGTVDISVK
jgi:hypothetical protein